VGDPAPDFELVSSDGETVALSDYEGEQPILLYFHMALG
jgi:peroxiredoxin